MLAHVCCCCAAPQVPGPTSITTQIHPHPLLFCPRVSPQSSVLWDLNTEQFLASQSYWERYLLHRDTAALPDLRELDIPHQKSSFFPHKGIRITAPHFIFDIGTHWLVSPANPTSPSASSSGQHIPHFSQQGSNRASPLLPKFLSPFSRAGLRISHCLMKPREVFHHCHTKPSL